MNSFDNSLKMKAVKKKTEIDHSIAQDGRIQIQKSLIVVQFLIKKMSKVVWLVSLIALATAQFSSFVKQYLQDVPKGLISSVDRTQDLDQYIKFTPANFKSIFGVNTPVPSFNSICTFPFILLNGICQCPRGLKFIFGICSGATPQDYQVPTPNIPDNSQNPDNQHIQCPLLRINSLARTNSIEGLALISRTYDGSANNQRFPSWGSAGSFLERKAPANYIDGVRKPVSHLPSPRVISNTMGSQSNPIKRSRLNATIAFTIFGQFVDHDLDLTFGQTSNTSELLNIPIPDNDPFFKGQKQLKFARSEFVEQPGQPRQQKNVITGWIDGSQIYGSDNTTNCALRTYRGGKLKSNKTIEGETLPLDKGFPRAGDIRVMENAILTSYHTIFVREHNRICDEVATKNPHFNDETIFQIARNYVIGLLQKIVLKDFVPILLGDSYDSIIGKYNGYRENINPNIPTEFSTACFRLGHPLLVNKVPAVDNAGRQYRQYSLNDLFFNPNITTPAFIRDILRGASRTLTKQRNHQLVDDVRNLLVLDPTNREVRLDLYSLNIQRGRDHGISSYNTVRNVYGLPKINTFEEILSTDELAAAKKLKTIYAHPDNIELFVGMTIEKPLRNAILGELAAQVVGQTFKNLRDGDRFWYENAYPPSVVAEIQKTQLGDIIRRNTQANDIASNVFKYSPKNN